MKKYVLSNMLKGSSSIFYSVWLLILIFSACQKESKLEETIRTELERGIKYDSLFLGLKFGIDIQEFYDHC